MDRRHQNLYPADFYLHFETFTPHALKKRRTCGQPISLKTTTGAAAPKRNDTRPRIFPGLPAGCRYPPPAQVRMRRGGLRSDRRRATPDRPPLRPALSRHIVPLPRHAHRQSQDTTALRNAAAQAAARERMIRERNRTSKPTAEHGTAAGHGTPRYRRSLRDALRRHRNGHFPSSRCPSRARPRSMK